MNVKKVIYSIVIIVLISLAYCAITNTVESNKLRRLNNQLRERIIDAENINRELAGTIEQCQSISGELGQSVERNINTAREAIELLEEIRIQVQTLENVTGNWNSDEYYSYWDSVFGLE